MKKLISISIGIVLLSLAACQSSPKREADLREANAEQVAPQKDKTPQSMVVSDEKESITFKGKKYESRVVRKPDYDMPVVENEEGLRYRDNNATLQVTSGGKVLVNRKFTKNDFASLVEPSLMRQGILEGLVCVGTCEEGLRFAASVGYPDADLYQPIRIIVTPSGKLSMSVEEEMEEQRETENPAE